MLKLTRDNYYIFAAGIGSAGLGVAVYNMYKTKQYRKTMLGLQGATMGAAMPEDDLNNAYFDADTAAAKVSSFTENYLDRGTQSIESVLQSDVFQDTLKKMGISLSPDTLNKKMIKNLLSAYGLFSVFVLLKSNLLKVGVAGLAVYLVTQNKDKIAVAFDSAINEVSNLT